MQGYTRSPNRHARSSRCCGQNLMVAAGAACPGNLVRTWPRVRGPGTSAHCMLPEALAGGASLVGMDSLARTDTLRYESAAKRKRNGA